MSQKEFVRERLAQLESGEIQPPKRRPGRPRIHPEGYVRDRKDPNVDPAISAARAEAGRKGQAVQKNRHMLENERLKRGRDFQREFDVEKAAGIEELKANGGYWGHAGEILWNASTVLEGIGWHREHPGDSDSFEEQYELLPETEQQKYYLSVDPGRIPFIEKWKMFEHPPEFACDSIITLAMRRVDLAKFPLVKTIAISALERFVEWTNGQKSDVLIRIPKLLFQDIEKALPLIKSDSFYSPFPEEPRPPAKTEAEQLREYRERYAKYPAGEHQDNLVEKQQRLLVAQEEEVLRQKAWQEQKAQEREQQEAQRRLLGFDVQQLLHPDIFGATPRRH